MQGKEVCRMIFDGCHFEYGEFLSYKHNLVFAHLDTSADNRIQGDISYRYLIDKRNQRRYEVCPDYASSYFEADVEIVTEDSRRLAANEQKDICKALFGRRGFERLYLSMADDPWAKTYRYENSDLKRYYLRCRFLNPSVIEDDSGGVIGYKCHMSCDSLMFWEDLTTRSYAISNLTQEDICEITVTVDTDLEEYIYPAVTINVGSTGGEIQITNISDSETRVTRFISLPANDRIIMNGEHCYVDPEHYGLFAGSNFLRLLSGENRIRIAGNVRSMTLEYSARRWM